MHSESPNVDRDTLKYHLANPGPSPEVHGRTRRLELAEQLRPITKVYLDTNYWISMRDAAMGRPKNASAARLLALLTHAVGDGTAICPMSQPAFLELSRTPDPETRIASADLVRRLSKGVCLLSCSERIETEFFHFVRAATSGPDSVHALRGFVWAKLPYVLGFSTPVATSLDAATSCAIAKSYFDYLWDNAESFTSAMMDAVSVGELEVSAPDFATKLNDGKFSHLHENRTYDETFRSELRGILSVYEPFLGELMHRITSGHPNAPIDCGEEFRDLGRQAASVIYEAVVRRRVGDGVPSLRIAASLHATARWDASRRFKNGDIMDFHHAGAALPYCDLFCTERSLCHLLHDGNAGLTKKFSCVVVAGLDEAKNAVEKLCRTRNA